MSDEAALEAGICGACGLCCNGSLFAWVPITREEEPSARAASLPVFQEKSDLGFRLPCPAHRGDRCSIYATRPKACADYRCDLLRRHDDGEVGRAEALARIAEARTVVARLRALLGPDEDGSAASTNLWNAIEARVGVAGDTIEWRRAHHALLLEAAVVETYLRRHFKADFRKPSKKAPDGPA